METNPFVLLPNGGRQQLIELRPDGAIRILCMDNELHRVHPVTVAAFGDGRIPTGVWQLACLRMQNPSAAPGLILPPDALRKL